MRTCVWHRLRVVSHSAFPGAVLLGRTPAAAAAVLQGGASLRAGVKLHGAGGAFHGDSLQRMPGWKADIQLTRRGLGVAGRGCQHERRVRNAWCRLSCAFDQRLQHAAQDCRIVCATG